jgi:ABC-type antimicrobial peptide transport system permease subunit
MTDLRPSKAVHTSFRYLVSPGYLRAAGATLLAGRNLTWHDDETAPRVALVSRFFANQIFGSQENALNHYFKIRDGSRVQVVGIVEDGKYQSLTEDPDSAVFFPMLQSSSAETSLIVRSTRDPAQLAASVRKSLQEVDNALPVYTGAWTKELGLSLFPARMATVSLGILGIMGAMLSITGIFGMAAYSVSRRLKELGIRLALGAGRREILQSALGRAVRLLAIGATSGLVLGLLATRVLAAIVYQATPRDPLVLTGVVVAMGLIGLLATWIPAQRALSLDPIKLLHEE